MKLLDYMNTHENWEIELAASPFYISTKRKGDYYLLKYNLFSDFTNDLVKQARGTIVRKDENGEWICVRNAFAAFRNYGELAAQTNLIDWNRGVSIQEKIDGSLISLYYDRGKWRIATSGVISAFDAECGYTNFGDLFISIIGINNWESFLSILDSKYCYSFELVSPSHNRVVVRYEKDNIYLIGARNMTTMEEVNPEIFDFSKFGIRRPKLYNYNSLSECIEAAHNLGPNEEGYVVTAYNQMEEGSFLRIKIKGDTYLRLHKLKGEGPLTVLKVIEMWQCDSLDDFIGAYPEHYNFVKQILNSVNKKAEEMNKIWIEVSNLSNQNRASFAAAIKSYEKIVRDYLFQRLDNKIKNPIDYLKTARSRSLVSIITPLLSKRDI